MRQSKKIAITGGIGSGKSAVTQILRERGYEVYSCDELYAHMREDENIKCAISEIFSICMKDGKLDQSAVAAAAFSDEEKLQRLNAYTHPLIMGALLTAMNKKKLSFAEVPLLYEGGYEGLFDGVIALRRDKEQRIQAVQARDGLSREQILARMDAQFDADSLTQKDCYVIENNGSLQELRENINLALKYFNIPIKRGK